MKFTLHVFIFLFLCTSLYAQPIYQNGDGARLKILDGLKGETAEITIKIGEFYQAGKLKIELNDCRYPLGNRDANAFAELTIRDEGKDLPLFQGWMIASAPAVSALEHHRYDIWVLKCTIS